MGARSFDSVLAAARVRLRNIANVARFGPAAPRVHEVLWVDPAAITRTFRYFPPRGAHVTASWPPAEAYPFEDHPHVRFALAHFRDGIPWEQTGAYEYMLERIAERGQQDGCRTLQDVVRRYDALDRLYEQAKRERRLRTRRELDPSSDGERGGILVHLAPDGEPIIGESGKHRLAIAKLLSLDAVPVWLGEVHRDALPRLPALRDPRRP